MLWSRHICEIIPPVLLISVHESMSSFNTIKISMSESIFESPLACEPNKIGVAQMKDESREDRN